MDSISKKLWTEKTLRLNANAELRIGLSVKDSSGNAGVIVKIADDTVYVWQSERTGYGSDNCEHYDIENWKYFLRIQA